MKKTAMTLTLVLVVAMVALNGFAIDRDASMIDELNLDVTSYDDADYLGLSITVENLMAASGQNWALLAGIGIGELEADAGATYDAIWAGLGVKWYLTPVTGISLMGTWRDLDNSTGSDIEITGGMAEVKQRLLPASMAISPYVKGRAALQEVDHPAGYLDFTTADKFTQLTISAAFGCEFMMNDTMAWVFEAGLSESENMDSGGDTEDGFTARLAMRYHWD